MVFQYFQGRSQLRLSLLGCALSPGFALSLSLLLVGPALFHTKKTWLNHTKKLEFALSLLPLPWASSKLSLSLASPWAEAALSLGDSSPMV